jgi:hypothetical protein
MGTTGPFETIAAGEKAVDGRVKEGLIFRPEDATILDIMTI